MCVTVRVCDCEWKHVRLCMAKYDCDCIYVVVCVTLCVCMTWVCLPVCVPVSVFLGV